MIGQGWKPLVPQLQQWRPGRGRQGKNKVNRGRTSSKCLANTTGPLSQPRGSSLHLLHSSARMTFYSAPLSSVSYPGPVVTDPRQAMLECWLCHLPCFVTPEMPFSLNFIFSIWVHVKESECLLLQDVVWTLSKMKMLPSLFLEPAFPPALKCLRNP